MVQSKSWEGRLGEQKSNLQKENDQRGLCNFFRHYDQIYTIISRILIAIELECGNFS